jgi:uncharacterized protein YjdB
VAPLVVSALSLALAAGCSKTPAGPGADGVETVVVSPPQASVIVGATLSLSAEVHDANGQVMAEPRISWASEDTSIATVSQDGTVTGKRVGTVLIAASSRGKDAFATITVNAPAVGRVVVSPQNPRIVEGATVQLSATLYDVNNQVISAGVSVSWTSGNTARATVSSNGLVLGVRQGTVTISAIAGGKTGSTTIRIDEHD